jgi:hypothetical protein
LEGILSELVLMVASSACAFAAAEIIAAKNVKQVGDAEVGDSVGLALLVDQQWEGDTGFFAEDAGVIAIAEANSSERSASVEKGSLAFAQLRDVLAAKDSAIMPKKDDHGGIVLPQRAEANFVAVSIGQNDVRELLAECLRHDDSSLKNTISKSSLAGTLERCSGSQRRRM